MKRTPAVILTLLVVLAGIPVAPGPSPTSAASAQLASGPSGMAAVPSTNIQADMPDGQEPAIAVDRLEGNVFASSHQSTLEVTVTTPKRADELLDDSSDGNVIGAGGVAFVLADSQIHAGREVGIPAKAVHDALGYSPKQVRGVHSSGSVWTRDVSYESGYLVFQVPEFSENSVTFTANVTIDATATDGFQTVYDVTDKDAVEKFDIGLTGVDSTEVDTVSAASVGNGGELPLEVAGTKPATDVSATLTGDGFVRSDDYSATSASLSSSTSIDVDGNMQPTDGSGGDPKLQVTAHHPTYTTNPVGDQGDGEIDSQRSMSAIGSYNSSNPRSASVQLQPDFDGPVNSIEINLSDAGVFYDPNVDVRIAPGGADNSYGEGTLVKDAWSPTWQEGVQTINLDSEYSVSAGETYEIELITQSADADNEYASIAADESASSTWSCYDYGAGTNCQKVYADVSFVAATSTDSVSVSDGSGTSVTFGGLSDGQTVTKSIDLSPSSSTLDWSGSGGGMIDWDLTMTERQASEDPSIDVDGDGTADASHTGFLMPGETVSGSVSDLPVGSGPAQVSTTSGTVDVAVTMTEHTTSSNIDVAVNGNETSYATTLNPGEQTSLMTDTAWIKEGSNSVSVSLDQPSADAPAAKVDLDYSHRVLDKQTITYSAEKWTSRYNVSRSFADARKDAKLVLPFENSVLQIRDLEMRASGGSWTDVSSSSYSLDGTTLTVQLGTVNQGDTVSVRANGSLAQVNNGSIDVVSPTLQHETLDSKVKLTDWASDSYILVPQSDERLVYTYGETFAGQEHALISASGGQQLHLPVDEAGGSFQVTTLPVVARPQTGDVRLEVGDSPDNSQPEFSVRRGDSHGDAVEYTFVNAKDDTSYILYSKSAGVVHDSSTASSPITLQDDDSRETLVIKEDSENTTSSGPTTGPISIGPVSAPTEGIPWPLVVTVAILIALAVLVRRFDWLTLPKQVPTGALPLVAAALTAFYAIDWASGHTITQAIGSGAQQITPIAGIVGVGLSAWLVYERIIKGSGPRPIQIVSRVRGKNK